MKQYRNLLADVGFDYGDPDLPMVFGSETEFGFAYGKVLDESRAYQFPAAWPERVFPLIIKMAANNTGAFVRDPEKPWEREGLNHFETEEMKQIAKGAASGNVHCLPERIKNEILRIGISPEDFHLGQVGINLPDGARLYIDGSHIEASTSECRDPRQVVCLEKAMERIIYEAALQAQEICGRQIFIFKNNTDGRGNSYGYHQNFALLRNFFEELLNEGSFWRQAWLSFIISDQIYTGGGKVGSEKGGKECDYQISQRADHISAVCGHDTMDKRPLINYRDEPLADRDKWGRLHVICGDSNMSEIATCLKIGAKALVLNMLQHQYFTREKPDEYKNLFISDPVGAFKAISRDLTCQKPLLFTANGKKSALEIQKTWSAFLRNFYLHSFCRYRNRWIGEIIEKREQILKLIENHDRILDLILDWRIKRRMIKTYIRTGFKKRGQKITYQNENVRTMDISYHDIGPDGFFNRYNQLGNVENLVGESDIQNYMGNSPENTRAWLRGQLIKHYPFYLTDIDWAMASFPIIIGDFKDKIRLKMEPLGSTMDKVGDLFDGTKTFEQFCEQFVSLYLNRKENF